MLKYAVILLADDAVSFCHYDNKNQPRVIDAQALRDAIRWAMIENVNVQFVYPPRELPEGYEEIIDTIDSVKIKPAGTDDADVVVANGFDELNNIEEDGSTVVLRVDGAEFMERYAELTAALSRQARINVVITDIASFSDEKFAAYGEVLKAVAADIHRLYKSNGNPQLNILTDRLTLDKMNNCNAGWESITIAPDGKFYVCPAFYYDGLEALGSVTDDTPVIPNEALYRLDHAPLCRTCDAWHCRRCVWLNRRGTLEVNTPTHEQCVAAHTERNASRCLRKNLLADGLSVIGGDIPELDYLDPFEKIKI